ncbi:hypothetical protein BH11PLA1_BH11PLA1_02150 [soil metagenome]
MTARATMRIDRPRFFRVATLLCSAGGVGLAASAAHGDVTYNFAPVDALAQGAVAGQNVTTAVPGFELLLWKDGVPVYHKSFGAWSLERVANCDSATKTMSAGLLMSLVQASPQPLTLDTRISQYEPSFTGDKAGLTIRAAFCHSSGLGNSNAVSSTTLTLQQAAAQIATVPLAFAPPFSEFSYGGTSMQAAGAAAEVAGGASWDTLFQQRIAGPLGLAHTRYVLSSPTNPRIAGGCEATATEFARYMEMLRKGGVAPSGAVILTPASVQTMLTRQTALGVPILNSPLQSETTDNADYGIGIWLDVRDAQRNLLGALAAGARGFSAWIDFDDGMVGVFATELTTAGNIQHLLYLIRGAAQTAIRAPICPAPCQPADVAWDDGTPLPPHGACSPALTNSGVNEGDYNVFFNGFFTEQGVGSVADIASDDGSPLLPAPPLPRSNSGVNEGDYNAFFNSFFVGCPV